MHRYGLSATLAWFVTDQVTKWWILNHVMDPPRMLPVTAFFNIVLGRNTGVSFGLLGGAPPWTLVAFAMALLVGLFVWMWRADNVPVVVALGSIAGGALGNVLDRLRHGAVTDFLDFHVAGYHWPAFNLADVAIVGGAALLLLDSMRPNNEHGNQRGRPEPARRKGIKP